MVDSSQSQEVDLDRTDRLPILEGAVVDSDVEDDAVRMDHPPVQHVYPEYSPALSEAAPSAATDIAGRSGPGGLPSLADSMRSVEERIARQAAEYEALTRSFEQLRDAESLSAARANALAVDLASARAAQEAEQLRLRELDNSLAEHHSAAAAARARAEEALREAGRYQGEARSARDALAERDATLVEALHSLEERDAQLAALQREHAKIVPVLEAHSNAGNQLEADLQGAEHRLASTSLELTGSQTAAASLAAQLTQARAERDSAQRDLRGVQAQASAYLEQLRTQDWRRGFDLNLFREIDAERGAAQAGRGAVLAEREHLQQSAAAFGAKLIEQEETIKALRDAASAEASSAARKAEEAREHEREREMLRARVQALEADLAHGQEEVSSRDAALIEARAAAGEALNASKQLAAAQKQCAEQAALLIQMGNNYQRQEQEIARLMAHLNDARRPLEPIESEVTRLTGELAGKTLSLEQLHEDNRNLQTALERTRSQLEEREFLIRRLERNESNNANVLGHIQTSMERLGGVPPAAGAAAPPVADWSAELLRVDGDQYISQTLARRTRIGRAPGCELQLQSASVSRNHALVLLTPRDAIIEDLNSTNGVLVNGRKISRQLLNDGDLIVVGDVPFRFSIKRPARGAAGPPPEHLPAGREPAA